MAHELDGCRVAFLMANEGVEEVELVKPWEAVEDAGGRPVRVASKPGTIQAFNHLDRGSTFDVDQVTADLAVDDFEGLVLPGGVANPDHLRTDGRAVEFVRAFFDRGKPVAVICHGPWTIVEADRVRDRTLTSWPSLQTDIRNAGGTWVDEEVQVCTGGTNVLVSSRKPDDLPAFCAKLVEVFSEAARHAAAKA
jgi:protease I